MGRRPLSRWTLAYLALVAFSLLGTGLSHALRLDPGPIAPGTALLTLGVGLIAAFRPAVSKDRRTLAPIVLVLLLGTTVELAGVSAGLPFGRYAYTERWWPSVRLPGGGWFPLLVPLAWGLMAGASALSVAYLAPRLSPWLRAPLAGLLAATLDLAMEPVMTRVLGYWTWLSPGPLPGGAPYANFLGWLATATLAALVLTPQRPLATRDPLVVLAGHTLLTLGLAVLPG